METLVQAHTSPNACKHAHRAPSVHTTDKCSFTLLCITHGNREQKTIHRPIPSYLRVVAGVAPVPRVAPQERHRRTPNPTAATPSPSPHVSPPPEARAAARRAAAGQNRPSLAGLAQIWQHRRGVVIAAAAATVGDRPAAPISPGRRHGPPPAAGGGSATPGPGSKRPRPGGPSSTTTASTQGGTRPAFR
ncbi:hypothetical protein SETIT_7G073900v2 [Setaria italica]|uniref:Uncharacterized protein n=1 Tax=Setaria italica TaxID=4555 RepID=A0A368RT22_SETIT|nr:hypothetical protein SETIT_7G073900v2 [Setaria italica]